MIILQLFFKRFDICPLRLQCQTRMSRLTPHELSAKESCIGQKMVRTCVHKLGQS